MRLRMNWPSVSFDWNAARAFLATVEEGSLSAAARVLGATQPTLGRQVAALERELGVTLFQRVGRGLTLTASGLELVDQVRAMAEAASQVALTASGHSQTIEGLVRVSASEVVAALQLPPILAKLRDIAPGVEIEIVASNNVSDLRRREADIAIRHFRPIEPDLIACKLTEIAAWLYATPDYLERIGRPDALSDLSRATFVGFASSTRLMEGLNGMGLRLTPANFSLLSESELVRWELVKQGLGIGVITEDVGGRRDTIIVPAPGLEEFIPRIDCDAATLSHP